MKHARHARFDAPFLGLLLSGVMLVGAFGCFGVSFAAQDAVHDDLSALASN